MSIMRGKKVSMTFNLLTYLPTHFTCLLTLMSIMEGLHTYFLTLLTCLLTYLLTLMSITEGKLLNRSMTNL